MTGVSVIIAAYNARETLGATLASVLAQTNPAEEIVVIDDGSTDDTAALAHSFPGISVVRQTNSGQAAAWNCGLGVTSAEVVAFLDADDLWPPSVLTDHLAILQMSGADGSVGEVEEFVSPDLPAVHRARLVPRARYRGWLAGATAVRRSLLARTGQFAGSLRAGAWIDWMDRARIAGGRFEVHGGLSLQRRLRFGTLGGATPQRDADLLEVARRALQRRRGDD